MFKKLALGMGGLASAAFLPYMLATGPSHVRSVAAWVAHGGPDQPPAEIAAQPDPATLPPLVRAASDVPLEGQPVGNLAEVMRFDIAPDWIMRRWPRVSSGLADLQLHGFRVPLVSGTSASDLAGSLTYYFNAQQRVQRITFNGSTGDVSQLVQLLTARFRLARRVTNEPSVMIYESTNAYGQPTSVATIRVAPVIRSGDTFRRYDVELVLERPAA